MDRLLHHGHGLVLAHRVGEHVAAGKIESRDNCGGPERGDGADVHAIAPSVSSFPAEVVKHNKNNKKPAYATLLIDAAADDGLVETLAVHLLRLDRLGEGIDEFVGLPEVLLFLG